MLFVSVVEVNALAQGAYSKSLSGCGLSTQVST